MTDYNNTFSGTTGSTVDASDLDAQFNNIVTSVLSKGNINNTAFTGTLTHNTNTVWDSANCYPDTGHQYGYQVLASGLIAQWYWSWGTIGGVQQTHNFLIPFPNAALSMVCCANTDFGGPGEVWGGVILSNTQFQVTHSWTGDDGCFWIAVGH